eukprot:Sspe_Gene.78936::Locus_49442_Transcript_1_1_Confidence_1.000_Length_472::g.78936::m.78936
MIVKLSTFLSRTTGRPYHFQEATVIPFLAISLARIKKAFKEGGPCLPSSKSYKELQEMRRLFAWLLKEGHEVKLLSYTRMIHAASLLSQSHVAQHFTREMITRGITPDHRVLNLVIASFKPSRTRNPGVLEKLKEETMVTWQQLTGLNVVPDHKCYE